MSTQETKAQAKAREAAEAKAKAEAEAKAQAEAEAKAEAEAQAKAEAEAQAKAEAAGLKSLPELEIQFRVSTWQSAALYRLTGWEDGKRVTENEYKAALEKLTNRRIGG